MRITVLLVLLLFCREFCFKKKTKKNITLKYRYQVLLKIMPVKNEPTLTKWKEIIF